MSTTYPSGNWLSCSVSNDWAVVMATSESTTDTPPVWSRDVKLTAGVHLRSHDARIHVNQPITCPRTIVSSSGWLFAKFSLWSDWTIYNQQVLYHHTTLTSTVLDSTDHRRAQSNTSEEASALSFMHFSVIPYAYGDGISPTEEARQSRIVADDNSRLRWLNY